MKKSLSLLLGVFFLTGAVLSASHASRDAYHNYQYQKGYYANRYEPRNPENLAVRPSTERVFGASQRALGSNELSSIVSFDTNSRNYRGSRLNSSLWAYNGPERETSGVQKTFSDRQGSWNTQQVSRESVSFGRVITNVKGENTLQNESFLLAVPGHWSTEVSEKMIEAGSADVKITAKVINHDCGRIGFYTCAVAFSKTLNGEADLTGTSKVERSFTNTYKSIVDTTSVTGTYTESFSAIKDGKDIFVTRYIVSGGNGNVYIIDGESSLQNGSELVGYTKKAFNSFHIK